MIGLYKITDETMRQSVADALQLTFPIDGLEVWICPGYGFVITSVREWLPTGEKCLFLDHIEGHRLVARQSLEWVEGIAKASGCKSIVCTPASRILGELYRRKGFDWFDDTYMRKAIQWAEQAVQNPQASKQPTPLPLQPLAISV